MLLYELTDTEGHGILEAVAVEFRKRGYIRLTLIGGPIGSDCGVIVHGNQDEYDGDEHEHDTDRNKR